MECADRIAVLTEERTLEPVRMMGEFAALTAVTVRVLASGSRFEVTVRRLREHPRGREQAFSWDVRRVGEGGGGEAARLAPSPEAPASADPEDAYWDAVEAIGQVSQ